MKRELKKSFLHIITIQQGLLLQLLQCILIRYFIYSSSAVFFSLSADFSGFRSFIHCLMLTVLCISILHRTIFSSAFSFSFLFLLCRTSTVHFPPKHKIHMPKLTTKVGDGDDEHKQGGSHLGRQPCTASHSLVRNNHHPINSNMFLLIPGFCLTKHEGQNDIKLS